MASGSVGSDVRVWFEGVEGRMAASSTVGWEDRRTGSGGEGAWRVERHIALVQVLALLNGEKEERLTIRARILTSFLRLFVLVRALRSCLRVAVLCWHPSRSTHPSPASAFLSPRPCAALVS